MPRGIATAGRTVLVLGRNPGDTPVLLRLTAEGWVITEAHLQVGGNPATAANPVPVDVVNNVAAAFDHGSNSAIGMAATRFIVANTPAVLGVEVKAANGNTANIYVGNADVTAASADATDGVELGPGESILVRIDNVNKLYGISTLASQRVFWLAV